MTDMKALVAQQLQQADQLGRKFVHPKLSAMFDLAGMKAYFHRGEGQYLYDADGNRFLDFLSSGGVQFIGRNHPAIQQAVAEVAQMDLPNLTILNPSVLGGRLAQMLIEMTGGAYGKVLFGNSGTEATDLALRFARYCTKKRRFLYLEGAFHGRTYASISCCGFPELREGMEPLMPTCTPIRINDIQQLKKELKYNDVAGVIVETVQGMTCEVMEAAYLREADALCRQHGALLIVDEVQTGLGRTGAWFDSLAMGVQPQMITLSKSLSGGLVPVSCVLIQQPVYEKVFDRFKAGPFYFSTFAENNLAMAAGIATLEALAEMKADERAAHLGELIEEGVNQLAERYDCIERVAGKGLFRAIYFKDSKQAKLGAEQQLLNASDPSAFAAAVHVDMYRDYRIMLQIPGPGLNAIKFLPPACSTEEDIFFFLQALDETLGRYYGATGPALGLGKTLAKALAEKAGEKLGNETVKKVLRGNRKNGAKPSLPTVTEGKGGSGQAPPRRAGDGASSHDLEAFTLDGFKEFGDYGGGIVEKCDFLVIGGGPAGIIAAKRLAEAGRDVLVVEAGRRLTADDFGYDLMNTTARYFWDAGVKPTRGNTFMASLRAKALGGGSVFNSAICMRPSRWALESWAENHGVTGLSEDELRPYLDRVEAFLGVQQGEHMMGRRNTIVRDGARKLGWHVEPLPRMTPGCVGSSECITGCRTGGKASVDRRGAPEVLRAGGRIYTSVQIDKLTIRDGRVLGAEGHTVDPISGKKAHSVRILAKCTILAAGVFATPALAQRSGLTRSVIGSNLRMHPSTNMLGLFDEEILPWEGATQGYQCLEFIDQGTKIEDLWATAGIFGMRLPSLGEDFARSFEQLRNMGMIAGWVGGEDSVGRVKAYPGYVDATYDLGEGDVRRLQQCTVAQAEILLAAGAKEVFLRFGPGVPKIRNVDELYRKVRDVNATVGHFSGASNHVFGTMPMGGDRERSATDSDGKVWDADNLYVCDTSLFPHSSGSNPMLPAMAMADRQAETLLDRY